MFECTSWNTNGLQQVKRRKVMSEEMNDQMLVRRQKLQELYDLGIDPFGSKFDRSGLSSDLKESGTNSKEELVEKSDSHVAIAGRLMTKRGKGKQDLHTFRT